jgi:hypothetical protein
VRTWTNDLRLGDAALQFADNRGVVAFALGVVLGLALATGGTGRSRPSRRG